MNVNEITEAQELFIELFEDAKVKDVAEINRVQIKHKFSTDMMLMLIEFAYLKYEGDLDDFRNSIGSQANIWSSKSFHRSNVLEEARKYTLEELKKHEERTFRMKVRKEVEKILADIADTPLVALPVEKVSIKAIQSAIDLGLDNENLGEFVRMVFDGE